MSNNEFLWVEKYRPQSIKDTILPVELKKTFQQFVDQKTIPNLILVGTAGIGKTTVARAMLEEINADYYVINGSMNGNIDTLRNDIQSFASTMSFSGGRKYVILDEADYLNVNSTQPALRNFMEEFSKNCGFILTCNYLNRIIEPLHSRCSVIDFKIPSKEISKLAMQFFKRIQYILDNENIEYDESVIAEIITKFFPDFRRIVNELQRYSAIGKIDSGIFVNLNQGSYDNLINYMKEKNFTEVRKWIGENLSGSTVDFVNHFYANCSSYFKPSSVPELVVILNKCQYQSSFVANEEINLAACMVEIMRDCEFK